MNWEIGLAIAIICLVFGVLASNYFRDRAAKAKSGASALLDDAKASVNSVVHDVEAAILHHPATPDVPSVPAAVDPGAAHAALDAAIASAQAKLDAAKAAKSALTNAQQGLADATAAAHATATMPEA